MFVVAQASYIKIMEIQVSIPDEMGLLVYLWLIPLAACTVGNFHTG